MSMAWTGHKIRVVIGQHAMLTEATIDGAPVKGLESIEIMSDVHEGPTRVLMVLIPSQVEVEGEPGVLETHDGEEPQ